MTEEEANTVEAYQLAVRELQEKLNAEPSDSLRQRMVVELGKSELSQRFMSPTTLYCLMTFFHESSAERLAK